MIRVALIEDHSGFRDTLETFLSRTPDFACVGAFADAASAIEQMPACAPDVVLMDLHLPGEDGLDCVRRLRARLGGTPIVMLTVEENSRLVFAALEAGASGYLVKGGSPDTILDAIQEAHRGGSPMSSHIARLVVQSFHRDPSAVMGAGQLTKREVEIIDRLSQGWSSKEIAQQFGLSIHTVNSHLRHIYDKLHVRSRTAATLKYLRG